MRKIYNSEVYVASQFVWLFLFRQVKELRHLSCVNVVMALTKSSEYDFSQQVMDADIFIKLNCFKMRKIKTRGACVNRELTAAEHLVLINEIKKLRYENALMKQLGTKVGFMTIYFKKVQRTKAKEEAFAFTNGLHQQLFGCVKFSSYDDFLTFNSSSYARS